MQNRGINSIKKTNKIHLITIFICICLIFGVYVGFSTPYICLCILICRLLNCNKETIGLFLLLFGGLLGGIIRQLFPFIPIYGLLLMGIGVICLHNYMSSIIRNTSLIIYTLVIFGIFLMSLAYGPISEFAKIKFFYIVVYGIFKLYAYYCLCRSLIISNKSIGELLVLLSILGIYVCIHLYGYQAPSDFLDFEWFRNGYGTYKLNHNDEEPLIGYQIIGTNALYALAFFLTSKNQSSYLLLFEILICVIITLISGARQSILGIVVICATYYMYFKGNRGFTRFRNIILGGSIAMILLFLFSQLENSVISSLFDTSQGGIYEQSSRELNFITAFILIRQNPIFGSGLGGYEATGVGPYPHNFILEILCECGIVGLSLILFFIIYKVTTCRINIRYQTPNGSFYFLIILCLFIRSSVSGDLTESIGLLMSILVIPKQLSYGKISKYYNSRI